MKCAWKELMGILPPGLRREVSGDDLWEIRLRLDQHPELIGSTGSRWLGVKTTTDDLNFVINTASRYSPWAVQTMGRGYITAPGGHRLGLGGEVVVNQGNITGFGK